MNKLKIALRALALTLLMLPALAKAQMPQLPAMPVDQNVRIGKLDNGLTYYIRHNEYPKGQADFYIAQKVGSIVENDDQRGLAHFLEHMCFNGTTHFPGKNLINYLESVGVKFGANLNAYTAVDQTVYNISNVPVAREGVQDSCLLILHDWANDLLLLPEEIEAERGVIHQEWRRSNVGQMRIIENLLPTIYQGGRYGYRLPIGTMDVVDNFAPQTLRDYYEKWYRPDLQGIIVVGDIDVDRIEGKIKEMFADIEMPADPAERVYFPVDDNEGTIYALGHDSEQQQAVALMMIKSETMPREQRGTMAYYIESYANYLIRSMLNTRLNDISSKPGAPFASASVSIGNFFLAKTKDALDLDVAATSAEQLPSALAAAYRELLRASRNGFTQTEFERAKAKYLTSWESRYNERNKQQTGYYVNQYVNNFLNNDPIPGLEVEYQTIQQIASLINVDIINQGMAQMVTPDNRVVMALMPENAEGVYPTEQQFADALAAVDGEEIEGYKEELKAEPLIAKMPKKGKIKKEEHSDQWDATVWTLSNGVKVIIKPTTFKDDEVLFSANAVGGTAIYGNDHAGSLLFLNEIAGDCGLGTYSESDLRKYLAGKRVGVTPTFSLESRTISGSSSPKDLATLMELIYMHFTGINYTADEFEALQHQYVTALKNQMADPNMIFATKVLETLYATPRIRVITPEDVEKANREEIIDICHQLTANAADYTFTFVGNVDLETLRPLVEQYIASLPANAKKATHSVSNNPMFDIRPGTATDTFTAKMQTPQTYVFMECFGSEPFNTKDAQLASVAGQILAKRYLDKIREEMGAVYSIGAVGNMDRLSSQNTSIYTQFPMKPEMKDEVLALLRSIMVDMSGDVQQLELDKVKEYMVKMFTENREKNNAWLGAISGWTQNGIDTFNDNIAVMNSITTADVQSFLKKLLDQGNYRVVVLDPEATPIPVTPAAE